MISRLHIKEITFHAFFDNTKALVGEVSLAQRGGMERSGVRSHGAELIRSH